MLKTVLLLGLVGLTVAAPKPTGSKTPEEIQAFREFLENSKHENGYRLSERMLANPKSSPWENSGKFEGDIILDQWQIDALVDDFAGTRSAYIWPNTKWPSNTIVYEFGAGEFNAQQQQAILASIRDIERNTCLRFRMRTASDRNFVRLTGSPDGCYAHVGYWDGRGVHIMNLARDRPGHGCFIPTVIIHEWLHVIGFFHMQSTYNRYNYVRILWENIWPGAEHNFYRYDSSIVSNLGLPYEYASCMHYGTHLYTVNGLPTIQAVQSFPGTMGQLEFVTFLDWWRANRHYNCPGAWREDIQDIEQLRELVHSEDDFEQRENLSEVQEYVQEQQDYVPQQQDYVPQQQDYGPQQLDYVPEINEDIALNDQ